MNALLSLGLWLAAAALFAAAIVGYGNLAGDAALVDAVAVAAAGAIAASGAFIANGLTRRPMLALSLPMLAGWWITAVAPVPMLVSFTGSALAGATVGGLLGLLAAGPLVRTAALSLALAVAVDLVLAPFAGDWAMAHAAIEPIAGVAGLALGCVAIAWWTEGSLAAALLHQSRNPAAALSLGLRQRQLIGLAGALGGLAGGVAGGVLAATAIGRPDVATGLVLAAATFAGGGSLAATLALVAVLWVGPELAGRLIPTAFDLGLWLAATTVLFVLVSMLRARLAGDDDG